jgi:hypothetical protein
MLASGATFNDLIGQAADDASNHGKFVRAVGKLAIEWKRDGLISGRDAGKIVSCAARSDIPSNDDVVVIGSCNSHVVNQTLESGATFNELIDQAAANANNHGEFVRTVWQLTVEWMRDGLISGRDGGKIISCAARSNIP